MCSRRVVRKALLFHQPPSVIGLHYLKRGASPQKIALYWHARASVSVFEISWFFTSGSRDGNDRPLPKLRLVSTYFGCTLEIGFFTIAAWVLWLHRVISQSFANFMYLSTKVWYHLEQLRCRTQDYLLPTLPDTLDGNGITVDFTFSNETV